MPIGSTALSNYVFYPLLVIILIRKENVDKPSFSFFVNFDKQKDKTLLRYSPLKKMQTDKDMELYSRQFKNKEWLIGKTISEIVFYLEETDVSFTEQPNEFGKSLLTGIDLKTETGTVSIGNRFTEFGYGLSIDIGKTNELEYFQDIRIPQNYKTDIIGERINSIDIYWMKIPFENEKGLYPQEIEIKTDSGFLMLSSIEVNQGKVDTEFTDELLVIDNEKIAKDLELGKFGFTNNRKSYTDLNELIKELKTGYNSGS